MGPDIRGANKRNGKMTAAIGCHFDRQDLALPCEDGAVVDVADADNLVIARINFLRRRKDPVNLPS